MSRKSLRKEKSILAEEENADGSHDLGKEWRGFRNENHSVEKYGEYDSRQKQEKTRVPSSVRPDLLYYSSVLFRGMNIFVSGSSDLFASDYSLSGVTSLALILHFGACVAMVIIRNTSPMPD